MVSTTLQQISVSLDTRIPLEALVLQRLHGLPKDRQSDWLRQLVLTAFRSECHVIKSEQRQPAFSNAMRKSNTTSYRYGGHSAPIAQQQRTETVAASINCSNRAELADSFPINKTQKPFTHLRRVIGEQ
ncbi:MAG: hypothetical protein V2I41_05145 [Pseudomonadales bacterium]|jgi:hypothetical protein|nr:hypothetical protein [Pseudomonadales bacterium]